MIFDNLYKIMRIKIKFLFLLGDLRAVGSPRHSLQAASALGLASVVKR